MFSRLLLIVAVLGLAVRSASGSDWPQWRGPNRDNVSTETGLLRAWPAEGPKVLWRTPVAEGYAGAAIKGGRLYLNDYDVKKKEYWVRCISMADGKDLWEWRYPVDIRPNHGITRTVSAGYGLMAAGGALLVVAIPVGAARRGAPAATVAFQPSPTHVQLTVTLP